MKKFFGGCARFFDWCVENYDDIAYALTFTVQLFGWLGLGWLSLALAGDSFVYPTIMAAWISGYCAARVNETGRNAKKRQQDSTPKE